MKWAKEKMYERKFERENTKLKEIRPNENFLGEQAKAILLSQTTGHLKSKASRQKP